MVRHNFELSFVLRFGYILRNAVLFLFFNHHFLITLFAAGHGRHYPPILFSTSVPLSGVETRQRKRDE